MTDTLATIAVTAVTTALAILYAVPAVGDACDRRRWFIAVRKRRRAIRLCTQKSLTWHSRAKYAQQVGRHGRADTAMTIAERWDDRLSNVADSENVDWLPPSWMPVLPTRERHSTRRAGSKKRQPAARKARWAPPLDKVRG